MKKPTTIRMYGTCPCCHDEQVAFDVTGRSAECGACEAVVKVADIVLLTTKVATIADKEDHDRTA